MKQSFKTNILLALIITALFVLAEQSYRLYNDILSFNLTFKSFLEQFAINFFITLLVSKRAIIAIYTLLALFIWFQLVHFSYYGTWIFPLEYLLFFIEYKEVYLTFKSIAYIAIVPTIIALLLYIGILFSIKQMYSKKMGFRYAYILLIIAVAFLPAKFFLKDNYNKYSKPNFEYYILKNTTLTLSNLFGHIIPKKLSGKSGLEQKVLATPKTIIKNPDINIILIMGESLNRDFMSLYGYNIQTTPFLDSLKDDSNFLYKKGISSGVSTVISIPSFIHMIKRPDGMPQILSTNTCIFKMAKESGFDTYFYSSQAQDELKGIKSYLCTKYLDELKDGTTITNIIDQSAYDIHLLDMMENVDFSKPVFLTMQQRASHTPFVETFPKEFEIYNSSNTNLQQESIDYINSIRYTDYVIKKILESVREKTTRLTYVIFTSDHATNVGNENVRGHGQLTNESVFKVPFFIYTLNGKNTLLSNFSDFEYISHYQITKIISSLLGYEVDNKIFNTKEDFYVNGGDISGLSGYLDIKFDTNNSLIINENR